MKIRNNGVNRLYKKWLVENYACPTTFNLFLQESNKMVPSDIIFGDTGIKTEIKAVCIEVAKKFNEMKGYGISFLNLPLRLLQNLWYLIVPEIKGVKAGPGSKANITWSRDAAIEDPDIGNIKKWFLQADKYLRNEDVLKEFSYVSSAVMISILVAAVYFGYKYYKKHKRPVGAREWAMYLGRKIKETF